MKPKKMLPAEIEQQSMQIIEEILTQKGVLLEDELAPVVKRVIHTTADFDYLENLVFSPNALQAAREAIFAGATIVTDTQMVLAGLNKKQVVQFGAEAVCYMSDPDVAQAAQQNATTRAYAAVDKAALLSNPLIFAVGNAPTALIRICELIEEEKLAPALVIGVPVGFVNVVEAKEWLLQQNIAYIVSRGRKGGSNVAAAILNAIFYNLE